MIGEAFAQSAGGAQDPQSLFVSLIPIIAMFGIFYFILIRPQMKQKKDHANMLDNLKEGNNVLTSGGIYGRIMKIKDDIITIQIAENVRVKVAKGSITSLKEK